MIGFGLPNLASDSFKKALTHALMRIPEDVYYDISETVSFVVEDPSLMIAVNVPFNRTYPACTDDIEVKFDTIIIFHQALNFSHNALVRLLAHEIAHTASSIKKIIWKMRRLLMI